jgi:hypothetical protein
MCGVHPVSRRGDRFLQYLMHLWSYVRSQSQSSIPKRRHKVFISLKAIYLAPSGQSDDGSADFESAPRETVINSCLYPARSQWLQSESPEAKVFASVKAKKEKLRWTRGHKRISQPQSFHAMPSDN